MNGSIILNDENLFLIHIRPWTFNCCKKYEKIILINIIKLLKCIILSLRFIFLLQNENQFIMSHEKCTIFIINIYYVSTQILLIFIT